MSEKTTMKCARFNSKGGKLELAEVPIPHASKGQVRIKVLACGVCHSDLFVPSGWMIEKFPRIPGHEVAGIVDEVGEGVTTFKKGDNVGVGWFGGNCMSCVGCRKNVWVCCEKMQVCGFSYDGGYAEYMVAPERALAKIPEKLDHANAAPLMCAGVTTFNSMRKANITPGSLIAVQGLGGLGHLAVQFGVKMGCKVVAISGGKDKEKLAKELGAHHYIDSSSTDAAAELQKMNGADVIVTTAPSASLVQSLIPGLGIGGRLLILAAIGEPLQVNTMGMLQKGQAILTHPSGDSRDSEDTMDFCELEGIRPIIETFPLDKAPEAFARMEENKARFRCVIVMNK